MGASFLRSFRHESTTSVRVAAERCGVMQIRGAGSREPSAARRRDTRNQRRGRPHSEPHFAVALLAGSLPAVLRLHHLQPAILCQHLRLQRPQPTGHSGSSSGSSAPAPLFSGYNNNGYALYPYGQPYGYGIGYRQGASNHQDVSTTLSVEPISNDP